jgi:hypothetical protein
MTAPMAVKPQATDRRKQINGLALIIEGDGAYS